MDNLKTCTVCKIDKIDTDFLLSSPVCYKCVYKQKTEKQKKMKTEKRVFCKMCDAPLPPKRWIYCSKVCSDVVKNNYRHWGTKMKHDSTGYKKRFLGKIPRSRELREVCGE